MEEEGRERRELDSKGTGDVLSARHAGSLQHLQRPQREKGTWIKITQIDPYTQGDTARDNMILTTRGDPASRAAPPPPRCTDIPARTHHCTQTDTHTQRQIDRWLSHSKTPTETGRCSHSPEQKQSETPVRTYRPPGTHAHNGQTEIQTHARKDRHWTTVKHTHEHIHQCTGTERRTSDHLTRTEATAPHSETD